MSADWIKDHNIKTALDLFSCWWSMTEAHMECAGLPKIDDDAVVLYFMGSGASCQVYAKNVRQLVGLKPLLEEFMDTGDGELLRSELRRLGWK